MTGKVIPLRSTPTTLRRKMEREARRELQELYRITAGFRDPDPPDEHQRQALEEGVEI